jgi:Kef-type K+ transport system membrane component KefB
LPFFFFWFGTTISLGEGVSSFWLLVLMFIWSVAGKLLTGYTGCRLFGLGLAVWKSFTVIPQEILFPSDKALVFFQKTSKH